MPTETTTHADANNANTSAQKFEFQAEVKQLLDIVIHSLYTEKEVFVRELISNASDALEKLRHTQLTEKAIYDDPLELEISVTTDDTAKTITLQDFGIGMTRDELVQNLGTIAHSGSKAFLKALSEDGAKNTNLIGQFGVGFYSVFMAAQSVKVYSRSWQADQPGHLWTSDGSGSYQIEEVSGERRGTKIVIHLKDDCSDFAQDWRIKEILERYSAFVSYPITLNAKRINTIQALWLRNKNEIKDDEYTEFYKFQAHAYDAPRLRLHFSADAPLAINSLLFVPKENTEKLGLSRLEPSVALYCRKVLIDAHPKDLLPEWLRFLKGVVDSEDLPLNISRETMQDKALIEKLGRVITKRFLKLLEDEAKNRPDDYATLYTEFGPFLKEGAAMDYTHKDQLTSLLRYESSLTESGKLTSLADYVTRMGTEQKEIYYLVGPNRTAIESGPYLEGFRARNLEVLYCYESVDEYVMNNLREFDGKKLLAADHADVSLPEAPQPTDTENALTKDQTATLTTWLKDTLGPDRLADIRASDRLVTSPILATSADKMMSPHMRRLMKAMKQDGADAPAKVNLEINPRHPVVRHLHALHTSEPEKAKLVAEQLLDNALISAGLLDDANAMVTRLNTLLASV